MLNWSHVSLISDCPKSSPLTNNQNTIANSVSISLQIHFHCCCQKPLLAFLFFIPTTSGQRKTSSFCCCCSMWLTAVRFRCAGNLKEQFTPIMTQWQRHRLFTQNRRNMNKMDFVVRRSSLRYRLWCYLSLGWLLFVFEAHLHVLRDCKRWRREQITRNCERRRVRSARHRQSKRHWQYVYAGAVPCIAYFYLIFLSTIYFWLWFSLHHF